LRKKKSVWQIILLLTLLFSSLQASLTDDLQGLVTDGNAIKADFSLFSFAGGGTCSELGTLNTSIEAYIASVEAVTAQITAPLSLTQDDLGSLEDLSNLGRSLAEAAGGLGGELQSIDDAADLVEYRSGLAAVLTLSGDIGTMADRIGEMANRILAMADNIGAMADKLVYTIALQSANTLFIEGALLSTQQNMVQLNASLSSISYNASLGQLVSEGNMLDAEMDGTVFSRFDMAPKLAYLEAQTAAMEAAVVGLYTLVNTNSGEASHYINGDTLTYLTDLGEINAALAGNIERFADRIQDLAPWTRSSVLSDATETMLQLAHDIEVMGDRIIEMSQKIAVMADNIGSMAGRIVEVQGIMNDNTAVTAASLAASQSIIVDVIGAYGL